LGNQLVELALLQLLTQGAQGKAEHGHGGAQAEGVLQGAGRAHLVVAQADAKATFPGTGRPFSTGCVVGTVAF
jgi:hypothetical protein